MNPPGPAAAAAGAAAEAAPPPAANTMLPDAAPNILGAAELAPKRLAAGGVLLAAVAPKAGTDAPPNNVAPGAVPPNAGIAALDEAAFGVVPKPIGEAAATDDAKPLGVAEGPPNSGLAPGVAPKPPAAALEPASALLAPNRPVPVVTGDPAPNKGAADDAAGAPKPEGAPPNPEAPKDDPPNAELDWEADTGFVRPPAVPVAPEPNIPVPDAGAPAAAAPCCESPGNRGVPGSPVWLSVCNAAASPPVATGAVVLPGGVNTMGLNGLAAPASLLPPAAAPLPPNRGAEVPPVNVGAAAAALDAAAADDAPPKVKERAGPDDDAAGAPVETVGAPNRGAEAGADADTAADAGPPNRG